MNRRGIWIFSAVIAGIALMACMGLLVVSVVFAKKGNNWKDFLLQNKAIDSNSKENSAFANDANGETIKKNSVRVGGDKPYFGYFRNTKIIESNGKIADLELIEKKLKEDRPKTDASGTIVDYMKEQPGLDSSRRSWYVLRNSNHETPGIPDKVATMLKKYDGYYIGDESKKVVYLTFDEGYENGYTPHILDVLAEKNQKATFFITGTYINNSKNLVQRIIDEGHSIGNHTMNHSSLNTLTYDKFVHELRDLDRKFADEFGVKLKYVRPPSGEYNEIVLSEVKRLGYKTIFWSFGYDDFDVNNQKGTKYAYDMVMNNLHNGAIILLHAVSKDNSEILDKLIDDIRQKGYTISHLDF